MCVCVLYHSFIYDKEKYPSFCMISTFHIGGMFFYISEEFEVWINVFFITILSDVLYKVDYERRRASFY